MNRIDAGRRIDQWLFFTRLCKSRSLAARLVTGGKIRVNKEKITKSASLIHVGDVITAIINRNLMVVEVVELGQRRGPYAQAIGLYKNLTPIIEKETRRSRPPLIVNSPSRPKGAGRPTKKHRRQLDLLKQRTD